MSDEKNKESTESFFLDSQNLNHLDENSAAELKSQKEYKDVHEQSEKESKENFDRVNYDTDHTNVANKTADEKNKYDGMKEEAIQQAKYENGYYNQNTAQNDFVFTTVSSISAFLVKYNPAKNKIQAIKIILNLEHPENQFSKDERAKILKEKLDFNDEEVQTVQKFEDYRSAVDKEDISEISKDQFIQDNENYVSLVMQKTGVSQQNQKAIINNFRNINLLDTLRNNWNLRVFSTFYTSMVHLYNTQLLNPLQEINVTEFNQQTVIISSNMIIKRQNHIPNMQSNISDLNNDFNDYRSM